jgi:hypothetical protein
MQARAQLSDRLQKGEVPRIEIAHRVDVLVTFGIHIDRYAAAVFGDTEPEEIPDLGPHQIITALPLAWRILSSVAFSMGDGNTPLLIAASHDLLTLLRGIFGEPLP